MSQNSTTHDERHRVPISPITKNPFTQFILFEILKSTTCKSFECVPHSNSQQQMFNAFVHDNKNCL